MQGFHIWEVTWLGLAICKCQVSNKLICLICWCILILKTHEDIYWILCLTRKRKQLKYLLNNLFYYNRKSHHLLNCVHFLNEFMVEILICNMFINVLGYEC